MRLFLIRNSTITANRANSGAGGGGIFTFTPVTIGNSIVAGNKGPGAPDWDYFGGLTSEGRNLIGVSDGSLPAGAPNQTGDFVGTSASPFPAGLGPLASNGGPTYTHALLPGSAAIDAGANTLASNVGLSTDQRATGFARIVDARGKGSAIVDIGAFEVQSLVVNTKADASDLNTGDGVCDADAAAGEQCTLRAAIEQANARRGTDAINFNLSGQGPHTITLGALGALPNLSSNLLVNGPGASVLTVERSRAAGTPAFRIFRVNSGQEVRLSGLTITNGRASGAFPDNSGGAIWNDHGTLIIESSTISANSADLGEPRGFGGGIYNDGTNGGSAALTITNSTISGNSAGANAGGIMNSGVRGSAALTIISSTISGNTGDSGGAILNIGQQGIATVRVTNSTISGNSARITGGIQNDGTDSGSASLTITNSTISGNSARVVGGGITTQGNTNGGVGGAILTITNSTITNNRADSDNDANFNDVGGGIYIFSGTVTLSNTLVAGNFHGSAPSTLADDVTNDSLGIINRSFSFNIIGTCNLCGLTNGANNNQVGVTDLRLGPLANNGGQTQTHALLPGSPALDRGSNDLIAPDTTDLDGDRNTTEPAPFDQRGPTYPRKADGADADLVQTVDIGAFEAHPSIEDIPDNTVKEDSGGTYTFNMGDRSLGAGYSMNATSSNTALLLAPNLICYPTGGACILTFLPAPNQFGTTIITVTMTNSNGATTSDTFNLTVNPVNDAPTFTKGANQSVNEDAAAQSVSGWATNLSVGPANESGQAIDFIVTNDDNSLFSVQPAIDPSGTLTFTPAANRSGTATVSVALHDNGGTANGGQDTSAIQTFTITVNAVNDAPTNVVPTAQSAVRNSVLVFSPIYGNAITVSDIDAVDNPLQVTLAAANGTITLPVKTGLSFSAGDGSADATMSFTGTISNINTALEGMAFTPAPDFSGEAALTLTTSDQGNIGSGGAQVATSTVNITVNHGGFLQLSPQTYTISESGGFTLITVTRTGSTAGVTRINYATSDGTATADSDYRPASGTLTFGNGITSQSFVLGIVSDTLKEPDETINITLSDAQGSGEAGAPLTAVVTITDDDDPTLQLSQANYSVSESAGFLNLMVTRSGDTSAPATVKYSTSDTTDANFRCDPSTAGQPTGQASRKCDYHLAVGTLRFGAGEANKQFSLSIIDDAYVESPESFTLSLSAPTGATLGQNQSVPVTILDEDVPGLPNPIDNTRFFVRQLYVDLLSREPDAAGWNGWTTRIDLCGQPGQAPPPCDRVTVGGDGFLRSGEFFDRQFFVLRLYRTGLGRILRYEDIGDLAYVSGFLTPTELELNKRDLAAELMSRPEFAGRYAGLDDTQFVDALLQTAGVTLPEDVRRSFIDSLATKSRAQVFREISERVEVGNRYLHEAQVVSAYYGFFTRNPDGAYLNYLQRLDSGEITLGDLANAFINAAEYRQRFGQ